ncbi:MAG: KH domain-containing protein [Verrucomicrobiota bacterium]
MEPGLALQEFLEFVVGQLVDHPEKASVLHEKDGGRHIYRVRICQEDAGKIIGRNGYTISSIRSLFQAAAHRHRLKATLKLDEVD